MYNTFAPCPTVERAVRIGFRPGTVRVILLCGPAPSRHRRGRPFGAQGTFVRALTGPGGARESVAHKTPRGYVTTPGANPEPLQGRGPFDE